MVALPSEFVATTLVRRYFPTTDLPIWREAVAQLVSSLQELSRLLDADNTWLVHEYHWYV